MRRSPQVASTANVGGVLAIESLRRLFEPPEVEGGLVIVVGVLGALGVSVVVFLMMKLVPGDPAEAILGPAASTDKLEMVRRSLGLVVKDQEDLVAIELAGVLHPTPAQRSTR